MYDKSVRLSFNKVITRVFVALVFIVFFSLFSIDTASAQQYTTIPDVKSRTTAITPLQRSVNVTISELAAGEKYKICLYGDQRNCEAIGNTKDKTADSNGVIPTFKVCGRDKNDLKENCNDQKDYFHAGHTYHIRVYNVEGSISIFTEPLLDIAIPIYHFIPDVNLAPAGGAYKVTISYAHEKPGPSDSHDYVAEIKDRFGVLKTKGCTTLAKGSSGWTGTIELPKPGERKLIPGTYRLYIKEQVGSNCEAGYEYVYIEFTVNSSGGIAIGKKVEDPNREDEARKMEAEEMTCPVCPEDTSWEETSSKCLKNDPDPNNIDGYTLVPPKKYDNCAEAKNTCVTGCGCGPCKTEGRIPAPCINEKDGKCLEIKSAIGNIPTEPAQFVKKLFSVILGVAGGIALILIIIAGYRFLTSQGNPEKVQAAREQLTSAIVGLLFIIFSFVILEVVGVDILGIPGFTR